MSRIVLVNGVFDVLHRGHIELLKYAKSIGDVLYVAIDSDERVKSIKGNNRPINSVEDRVYILNAIRYVDKVLTFNTLDELRYLHRSISPDTLVKGSDWDEEYIRKNDGVLDKTKIVMFRRINDYSTTSLIDKMEKL
jgi:D-beta-D-heptose 7-phosphate kinase/D-beta-D-heptose 1-phosphate adenosyltransferase